MCPVSPVTCYFFSSLYFSKKNPLNKIGRGGGASLWRVTLRVSKGYLNLSFYAMVVTVLTVVTVVTVVTLVTLVTLVTVATLVTLVTIVTIVTKKNCHNLYIYFPPQNCDKTQKLKLLQNIKTQIVTKLENTNCNKTQKLKKLNKNLILTKLKNSNCDETEKQNCDRTKKIKL